MSRRPNWLLRAPAQITIWLLLLFVALGPQHHLSVCTNGDCRAVPAPDADPVQASSCCCDSPVADPSGREGRGPRAVSRRCHDCCVDLALLTEVGPLPKAVAGPDLSPLFVAQAANDLPEHTDHGDSPPRLHATGPPRPDPRTALLATTILRI